MLSPFVFPSLRGNAITVNRIAHGLAGRGVELRVWDCSVTPPSQLEAEVAAYRPHLIHAFHAYRVGPLALRVARSVEVPLLVTITGTDGNHDLFDPERAQSVRRVLEGAATVAVFHESMGEKIARALPDVVAKTVVIPQSVELEDGLPYPLAEQIDLPLGAVLFFLPAGIRMVKNPLFPFAPFDRLLARYPAIRILYAGPILDPVEGEHLLRAIADRPWAAYLGAVPHGRMRGLLGRVHVVLNCSLSEGGMANSILEAMACARPVLASNIEGNRSLVEDGVTGFLFAGPQEFEAKAARLVEDPQLRLRMGLTAESRAQSQFRLDREVEGYLAQYQRLVLSHSVRDLPLRGSS